MSYANMDGVPTQTAGTSELLASDWNTYVRDNFDSIKFGHIVCTSSTRPTGIAEGTMIYETDTQKVLVYSGSSWIEINDLDRAGALPETSPGHLIVADNTAKSALSATEGMMVYQSDNNKVFVYNGSSWVEISDTDTTGGLSDAAPRGVVGRSEITANTSISTGGWIDSGMSITFTADSSRLYLLQADAYFEKTINTGYMSLAITDNSNNQKQRRDETISTVDGFAGCHLMLYESGLSGSITRKVRFLSENGDGKLAAGATFPNQFIILDVGLA